MKIEDKIVTIKVRNNLDFPLSNVIAEELCDSLKIRESIRNRKERWEGNDRKFNKV